MSNTIKAAILALKSRIAAAYTAISNRGGTLPATQDSANLATAIASIKGWNTKPLKTLYQAFMNYDGDIFSFDGIDTSNVTTMYYAFNQFWRNNRGNIGNQIIDLAPLDTSKVTNMQFCFALAGTHISGTYVGAIFKTGGLFTTKNVTNFNSAFSYAVFLYPQNLDTTNGQDFRSAFHHFCTYAPAELVDLSTVTFANATNVSNNTFLIDRTNIIGEHTLEEVEAGTCVLLGGLKISLTMQNVPLDYKNMLACAKGVADMNAGSSPTLTFKASTYNDLTQEEKNTIENILIAKHWTLATA